VESRVRGGVRFGGHKRGGGVRGWGGGRVGGGRVEWTEKGGGGVRLFPTLNGICPSELEEIFLPTRTALAPKTPARLCNATQIG